MNTEIRELLDEEIKTEFSELSSLEAGSKEKSEAVEDLVKLYKLKIEEDRTEQDSADKTDERKLDEKFKSAQMSEQVKDRYFRLGAAAAELVLPMIFYAVWMRRGFKFEEKGTYTSATFRSLWNRFRPTK